MPTDQDKPLASTSPPPPPSPCISVCAIDPKSHLCIGCHRTMNEIAGWGSMSNADKQRVLDELKARAQDDFENVPDGT